MSSSVCLRDTNGIGEEREGVTWCVGNTLSEVHISIALVMAMKFEGYGWYRLLLQAEGASNIRETI